MNAGRSSEQPSPSFSRWSEVFTQLDWEALHNVKPHLPRMVSSCLDAAMSGTFLRYSFAAFGLREAIRELLATIPDTALAGQEWAEQYVKVPATSGTKAILGFTRGARIRGLAYLYAPPSYVSDSFKRNLEEVVEESKHITGRLSALGHIRPEENYMEIGEAHRLVREVLLHIRKLAMIPEYIKFEIVPQFKPYLVSAVESYIIKNEMLARIWSCDGKIITPVCQRYRITSFRRKNFSFTADFDLPVDVSHCPELCRIDGGRQSFHVMGEVRLTEGADRFAVHGLLHTTRITALSSRATP